MYGQLYGRRCERGAPPEAWLFARADYLILGGYAGGEGVIWDSVQGNSGVRAARTPVGGNDLNALAHAARARTQLRGIIMRWI